MSGDDPNSPIIVGSYVINESSDENLVWKEYWDFTKTGRHGFYKHRVYQQTLGI